MISITREELDGLYEAENGPVIAWEVIDEARTEQGIPADELTEFEMELKEKLVDNQSSDESTAEEQYKKSPHSKNCLEDRVMRRPERGASSMVPVSSD
ncbi:hypothetical protein TWF281_003803 [Arthrobotrys megalospora]